MRTIFAKLEFIERYRILSLLDFKSLKRTVPFLDVPNIYVPIFIYTCKNTWVNGAPLDVINCVFPTFKGKNWFFCFISIPQFDCPVLGRRKEKVIHNVSVFSFLTGTWMNIDFCDHGFVSLHFSINICELYNLIWIGGQLTSIDFRILACNEKSRLFCLGETY